MPGPKRTYLEQRHLATEFLAYCGHDGCGSGAPVLVIVLLALRLDDELASGTSHVGVGGGSACVLRLRLQSTRFD